MSAVQLIPQIRAALAGLRSAERKVAEAVLVDVDFAMRASITDLAARSNVSEPSVTRFCRAVGCTGLREFKILLAQNIATGVSRASTNVVVGDSFHTLIEKVSDAAIEAIQQVRKDFAPDAIEEAISTLASARRIYFFGVGPGSGLVAQDACLSFLRMGISANAFSDAHLQRFHAHLMEPTDVAFAISHAGVSTEVNDSIRIASKRGAKTLGLTTAGTELAHLVDIPILLRLPVTVGSHTPRVSRLAHLCLIDVLAIGVGMRLGSRNQKELAR